MAIKRKAGGRITGLSTDSKPTAAAEPVNTIFQETDTCKDYYNTGTAWLPKSVEGAYKYIIFLDGSTYYCQDAKGKTVSSNSSPTTVIQYALDNLTVGRTYKETVKIIGDYIIGKITIPSFCKLDLTNAKLFLANGTNTNMITNTDTTVGNTDIEIDGGILDGNRGNNSVGTQDLNNMIRFEKCSNVLLHNGKYTKGANGMIMFRQPIVNCVFTNNTSMNPTSAHISYFADGAAGNFRSHIISNNFFFNDTDPAIGGATYVETYNVDDILISGNVCQGHRTTTTASAFALNGLRHVVVGNNITNSGGGIVLAQGAGSDFDTSTCVISGNIVRNCVRNILIATSGLPGSRLVVSDNIIDTNTEPTTTGCQGLTIQDWENVTVTGNIVSNIQGTGIAINGNTANGGIDNVIVANNIVFNSGMNLNANEAFRSGINLYGGAANDVRNVTVMGNRCYDNQGTKTQRYGIRLANALNCIVRFNDVRDNLTAGCIYTTSTGTTTLGNTGFD